MASPGALTRPQLPETQITQGTRLLPVLQWGTEWGVMHTQAVSPKTPL